VRLRLALVATALGLVLALVATSFAVSSGRDASRTARDALVDKLAAQSVALRSTQRDLAALLAVEAYRLRPDARTRSALLGVFTAESDFLGYLPLGSENGPDQSLESGGMLSDGTLVAASTDGLVRLLDGETGAPKGSFPGAPRRRTHSRIAVSRDESTLAQVSWEGDGYSGQSVLRVFDISDRKRRFVDVRLPLDAGAVAVSRTGRYVAASGYDDGRVLIYDTSGASQLPLLATVGSASPGVVSPPPVGPSAQAEAVQDYVEGRAKQPAWLGDPRLADPRLNASGVVNTAEQRYTAALVFLADDQLVVGSEVDVVRVIDPHDGRETARLDGAPWLTSNRAAAVSADGSVLVTAGSRGVAGWDLRTKRLTWVTDVDGANCSTLVIEPRTRSVLCGGQFSRVVGLDLDTGQRTPTEYDMQRGEISELLISPDGRTLLQLSRTAGVIARWSLDGMGRIVRPLPGRATPIGYNADGTLLLTTGPDVRTIDGSPWLVSTIVSAASGRVIWRSGDYVALTWTDDPARVVVWSTTGQGWVLDITTGRLVHELESALGGYSPDGQSLPRGGHHLLGWVYNLDGSRGAWAEWDLSTGALVATHLLKPGGRGSVTPDGRLVSAVNGGQLTTYDLSSGAAAGEVQLATMPDVVTAAAATDYELAAALNDGGIGFYDPRTLEPRGQPLAESPGQVEQLEFADGGRLMAARTATGDVWLVDVKARIRLGEPVAIGPDRTHSAALHPDGSELAVRTDDGLRVWDLRPQHWVRSVCATVGRSLSSEEWATFLGEVGPYDPSCR